MTRTSTNQWEQQAAAEHELAAREAKLKQDEKVCMQHTQIRLALISVKTARMRRQNYMRNDDDDNHVSTSWMTIKDAVKRDKAKASNTRLLMVRDDVSVASTSEPEGPSSQRNAEPTLPANAPNSSPAAESAPTIAPDSLEAIVRKVLAEMAPPGRRHGLRVTKGRKGVLENSDDDGDGEDEGDTLRKEKASAALAGTRNGHLVSESCLNTSRAKTDLSTGQSPKLVQANLEDQPGQGYYNTTLRLIPGYL
jgi:hypothetical protein